MKSVKLYQTILTLRGSIMRSFLKMHFFSRVLMPLNQSEYTVDLISLYL